MLTLSNRRIILAVTGGIAAYKACEIIRRLKEQKADVRVVMTEGAKAFITPLTLQALSGNPVHDDLLDDKAEAAMGHIELARWADAILIAPASADSIANINQGIAKDLLGTLLLASTAKKFIAPAMNQAMYQNVTNLENIAQLTTKGFIFLGPGEGAQACGDIGPGRMLEPLDICQQLAQHFEHRALQGKTVVITAGPTQEALDPVRYISNHSSGKMGFALARAASDAGAKVVLIAGPVHLNTPERVERINVISADDMLKASLEAAEQADIFIASAAVADYKPANIAADKIKKSDETITLTLTKNPDIVASVASTYPKIFVVGFAAETQNLIEHAKGKLQKKQLNLIVANDVSQQGIGFNHDENAVTVISREQQYVLERQSKQTLATSLIDIISQHNKNNAGASDGQSFKKGE